MFVVIHEYKARIGEEDAIIALHEDWERTLGRKAQGYIAGELLRKSDDSHCIVSIAWYESEMAYDSANKNAEILSWRRRLASLAEEEPAFSSWLRIG